MRLRLKRKDLYLGTGILVWPLLAAVWLWTAGARSFAPGVSGHAAPRWPEDVHLKRHEGNCTLVTALHPECPCSRATLRQLEEIVEKTKDHLHAYVLCVHYAKLAKPIEQSPNWKRAQHIPGITLIADPEGAESLRFGARTSGETRLYGPRGELLFHGGITPSRGHIGDNPGQTAILEMVSRGDPAPYPLPISTPVFGCSL